MSKRRRRRKPRGPGVYQNPDGSTTTIAEVNGMIIETKVRANPRPGEARKQVMSRVPVAGPPAGIPISGLEQAPVIRTNVIPGEKPGVIYDQGTGLEFTSRADLDRHYKEHNLVDMSGREGARRMEAPSYAELPKSNGSQFTRAFDTKAPPPAKIDEHTIMTNSARKHLFGGTTMPNRRRFR